MSFFFHAIDALALVLKLYKAYTNKYLESSWKKIKIKNMLLSQDFIKPIKEFQKVIEKNLNLKTKRTENIRSDIL